MSFQVRWAWRWPGWIHGAGLASGPVWSGVEIDQLARGTSGVRARSDRRTKMAPGIGIVLLFGAALLAPHPGPDLDGLRSHREGVD